MIVFKMGAPHWWEALAVQLEGMVIKTGAGFKTLFLNSSNGALPNSIVLLARYDGTTVSITK